MKKGMAQGGRGLPDPVGGAQRASKAVRSAREKAGRPGKKDSAREVIPEKGCGGRGGALPVEGK